MDDNSEKKIAVCDFKLLLCFSGVATEPVKQTEMNKVCKTYNPYKMTLETSEKANLI